MKRALLALTTASLLSACGSGQSSDELMPGNWRMSAGMKEFEVPGATPDQASLLQRMAGEMMSQEQCLRSEEAKFDPAELAQAFEQGGDCKAGNFTIADGTIEGVMSCTQPGGITSEFAITGAIAPERFSMNVEMELHQDGLPGGKANVTMEVAGERLGEC